MASSFSQGENDDIKIKGPDDTIIGNVGDRLKVDATVVISPQPNSDLVYAMHRVLNAGSDDLRPNGTLGSPVNCDWTVPSGETWYIESIHMFLQDNGTTSPTAFGSIAGGLTNGALLQIRTKGTLYTLATLNNNMHLQLTFKDSGLIPPTAGLFESSDIYAGSMIFDKPVKVQQSTSDFVRWAVRDNTTGLDQFKIWVKAWRLT